jgi:hypothetical protein
VRIEIFGFTGSDGELTSGNLARLDFAPFIGGSDSDDSGTIGVGYTEV